MDTSAPAPDQSAADRAGATGAMLRALGRWGGVLVQPRATVAGLDPAEGHRDGLWLGLMYLAGTSLYQLAEAAATLFAVRNLSGVVAVASILGRAVLAPVLTIVVAEALLGRERAHRRGLALVPLVLVGSVVHMARQFGHPLGLSAIGAAVVGAGLGLGLALWVRPRIAPYEEASS